MDGADINHYSKKSICKDKIRGSALKTEQIKQALVFIETVLLEPHFMWVIKYSPSQQNKQQLLIGNFFITFSSQQKYRQLLIVVFFFPLTTVKSINLNEEAFKQNISFYCIYSVPGNSYTFWRTQRCMFLSSFKVGRAVSSQLLSLAGKLYSLNLPGS